MSPDRREWRWPWRRKGDSAADVRDELDAHIALHIADLVAAGWSREAAVQEATRRFGDRRRVERELFGIARKRDARARRSEVLGDLLGDVRLALRQLGRQRLFAAAVIVVIALGVGATTAVFAVVDAGLFRPLPFPDGDRLVYLRDKQEDERHLSNSLPELEERRRDATFAAGMIGLYAKAVRVHSDGGWEVLTSARITGDLRTVFGFEPLVGRWFTPEELRDGARVALLDEATWRSRYAARRDVAGEELRLADGVYTVVGVLPRAASLLRAAGEGGAVDLWLPLVKQEWMIRGHHFMPVIARLRDGLSLEQARAGAAALERGLHAAGTTDHGIDLTPARDILVGDARPTFWALAGAAAFVLLTVCANLANLFVWKSLTRAREFAVRAALGASRRRLVRQVLTESVIIGLFGGAAGLLLSGLLIGVTRAVASRAGALAPTSSADPRLIGFAIVVSILISKLFGLWPALRASRADVAEVLKADAAQVTSHAASPWRRKLLVSAEVALSVVLLAGTGLLVRSLMRTLGEDPGFRPERVVAMRLTLAGDRYDDDARKAEVISELTRRVQALPGVASAAVGTELPLEGDDTSGSFEIVGRDHPDGAQPSAKKRLVGPGYFETMGIPILRGRGFQPADRVGAPDVVIISESIARRYWPTEDAVGKRMRFSWGPGDEQEIVGVVGDVRHDGLDLPITGILYRPVAQFIIGGLNFVVRTSIDPGGIVAAVRREVAAIDPTLPLFDIRTLPEVMKTSTQSRRDMIWVLGGFAGIAALLAAVGAYAVTAQSVTLRTREIGLRIAIGAQPQQILRMVVVEGALVIGLGVAAGVLGALAAMRVLSSMLYRISPQDPVALAAAVGLLLIIAALAIYVPARRASRLDPMSALRT